MSAAFIFYGIFFTGIQVTKTQCNLTPCEVLDIVRKDQGAEAKSNGCASDVHWRQLDRRLQAIEQPG